MKEKLCNELIRQNVVENGDIINHSYTNGLCGKNPNSRQTLEDYIESKNGIMPTMTTRPDTLGVVVNEINKIEISQLVKVRKYPVNVEKLKQVLRDAKIETDLTNSRIAFELDVPLTTVEHWFRKDNSFSIPEEEIWYKLKKLLCITTCEFDESITIFEEKEGVYEKSNRYYLDDGISPTITSTSANENEASINDNTRTTGNVNEEYLKRVKGNSGVSATAQKMVLQYRENIIAIDRKIIKELNILFMGLY